MAGVSDVMDVLEHLVQWILIGVLWYRSFKGLCRFRNVTDDTLCA